MTRSPDLSPGTGASPDSSRFGPSLSVLGLAAWVVTAALYLLLMPGDAVPGEPMTSGRATRLILTFVIGGLGVFAASIVSALGLFLSLAERRHRPARRATRGVVLGAMGGLGLVLVVVEIFRVAFATT